MSTSVISTPGAPPRPDGLAASSIVFDQAENRMHTSTAVVVAALVR